MKKQLLLFSLVFSLFATNNIHSMNVPETTFDQKIEALGILSAYAIGLALVGTSIDNLWYWNSVNKTPFNVQYYTDANANPCVQIHGNPDPNFPFPWIVPYNQSNTMYLSGSALTLSYRNITSANNITPATSTNTDNTQYPKLHVTYDDGTQIIVKDNDTFSPLSPRQQKYKFLKNACTYALGASTLAILMYGFTKKLCPGFMSTLQIVASSI